MVKSLIEQTIGFGGQWVDDFNFRVDPLTYGYMSPVQRVEIEQQGIHILSSPITNTEWWQNFLPISSCPRYKGELVVIEDAWNVYCQEGQCEKACGAEDGFVDLSAARLRLIEEADYISKHFSRLQKFLDRTIGLIEQINGDMQVGIGLDLSTPALILHARVSPDRELLGRHFEAFKKLYSEITHIQGKVDTSVLPVVDEFTGATEDELIEEARYYALKEAVKLESGDILNFLINKKGGHVEDNQYHMPNENLVYILQPAKIEAYRQGLYMGSVGFDKGVSQLQQFFATTLGGGRW